MLLRGQVAYAKVSNEPKIDLIQFFGKHDYFSFDTLIWTVTQDFSRHDRITSVLKKLSL